MEQRPKPTDTQDTPGQTPPGNVDPSSVGQVPGAEQSGQNEGLRVRIGQKLGDFILLATVESSHHYDVAKRNAGRLARGIGNVISTAGGWTKEKSLDGIDVSRLKINQWQISQNNYRRSNAYKKKEELIVTRQALKTAARGVLAEGNALEPSHLDGDSDGPPPNSYYTISKAEQRQNTRQYKRARRNTTQAFVNHDYALTYGHTIGSSEHHQHMARTRLTKSERREANRASKQYAKNTRIIETRMDRVKNAADGLDIPGARIERKIKYQDRVIQKSDKHDAKLVRRDDKLGTPWLNRHPN